MCQGKTLKGKICKKPCTIGSRFCKIHGAATGVSNTVSVKEKEMLKKVVKAQRDAAIAAEYARTLYEKYQMCTFP